MTAVPRHISDAKKAMEVVQLYQDAGHEVVGVEFKRGGGFKIELAKQEEQTGGEGLGHNWSAAS